MISWQPIILDPVCHYIKVCIHFSGASTIHIPIILFFILQLLYLMITPSGEILSSSWPSFEVSLYFLTDWSWMLIKRTSITLLVPCTVDKPKKCVQHLCLLPQSSIIFTTIFICLSIHSASHQFIIYVITLHTNFHSYIITVNHSFKYSHIFH